MQKRAIVFKDDKSLRHGFVSPVTPAKGAAGFEESTVERMRLHVNIGDGSTVRVGLRRGELFGNLLLQLRADVVFHFVSRVVQMVFCQVEVFRQEGFPQPMTADK